MYAALKKKMTEICFNCKYALTTQPQKMQRHSSKIHQKILNFSLYTQNKK